MLVQVFKTTSRGRSALAQVDFFQHQLEPYRFETNQFSSDPCHTAKPRICSKFIWHLRFNDDKTRSGVLLRALRINLFFRRSLPGLPKSQVDAISE